LCFFFFSIFFSENIHFDRYTLSVLTKPWTAQPVSRQNHADVSALVNTAYQTLTRSDLRAEHLLARREIDIGEGGTSAVDPALLMAVLETREEISDPATPAARLAEIARDNAAQLAAAAETLDAALAVGDADAARAAGIEIRYYTRITDALDAREDGGSGRVQ
jgi:DnaJ-domain-containing protein 1